MFASAYRLRARLVLATTAAASVVLLAASPAARSDGGLAEVSSPLALERLTHDWRVVEGKHWQIKSTLTEETALTDDAERTRGVCGPGMVEIAGHMKVDRPGNFGSVEELQSATCSEWISREFPERCALFDRVKWLAVSRDLETTPLHFCVDRFEYPNQRGAYPWVFVSWYDAGAVCTRERKRLCSEVEWTFACEGEEATPYPYGYERAPEACVVDRPWSPVDAIALEETPGLRALLEVDRLWQGEASGARPRCRSRFGVYDMTGNVDEWTTSVRAGERSSILKGGYWGPVRARCRPSTRAHGGQFAFYQQGFRCCADAPSVTSPGVPEDPADSGSSIEAGDDR